MSTATPRPGQLRLWLHGWSHVAFLVLNLVTALVAVVIALFIVLGAVTVPAIGVGLLILAPAMWAALRFASAELSRIEIFTGTRIVPAETTTGRSWATTLGLTRAHWRAAVYTGVHSLWGLLIGSVVAGIAAVAVALLALPLYAHRIPDGNDSSLWFLGLSTTIGQVALWVLALLVLLALPLLARQLSAVDIQLARGLLGRDQDAEIAQLSDRVETLTVSRSETVDSVESERRRIERDLHDGPQQRLVAIAMDLGMARERLAHDPEGARELLDKAHQASKEAIVEMRHVARGITPPILADRGLDAAVSALATRSSVPVQVDVSEVGRLDPRTEAIAYFCVSELLTNVAKHSRAEHAWVRLHRETAPAPRLVIEVEDDGVGGIDPRRGSGLVGLRQRIQSVDGNIQLHSPEGGPSRVVIHLPYAPVPPSPHPASRVIPPPHPTAPSSPHHPGQAPQETP